MKPRKENSYIAEVVQEIKGACGTIRSMDMWLPRAIDDALHGHKGKLDRVDIDEMTKERKQDDHRRAELNTLEEQVNEIAKQTRYIFWAFIATLIGVSIDIVLRLLGK